MSASRNRGCREKKERPTEHKMEGSVQEKHENCGVEGGGCGKRNSVEKENEQLHRRTCLTLEEEEEEEEDEEEGGGEKEEEEEEEGLIDDTTM